MRSCSCAQHTNREWYLVYDVRDQYSSSRRVLRVIVQIVCWSCIWAEKNSMFHRVVCVALCCILHLFRFLSVSHVQCGAFFPRSPPRLHLSLASIFPAASTAHFISSDVNSLKNHSDFFFMNSECRQHNTNEWEKRESLQIGIALKCLSKCISRTPARASRTKLEKMAQTNGKKANDKIITAHQIPIFLPFRNANLTEWSSTDFFFFFWFVCAISRPMSAGMDNIIRFIRA